MDIAMTEAKNTTNESEQISGRGPGRPRGNKLSVRSTVLSFRPSIDVLVAFQRAAKDYPVPGKLLNLMVKEWLKRKGYTRKTDPNPLLY